VVNTTKLSNYIKVNWETMAVILVGLLTTKTLIFIKVGTGRQAKTSKAGQPSKYKLC
jgi:hypothetical protein